KTLAQHAFTELKTNGYIRYEDLPLETKDGRSIDVEFVSNAYLVGDKKIFQCNIRDITERKRADLDLLSAQERLKEAHRLAHIGIWDWVMESDTVTWSDELYKIAGRDPSLPAPTYTEHPRVYTPASWDLLSSAVTRALTTGELYNLELELVRPDGNIRWVNAFGGVKRDGDGKVIGLYGTVQDITGRKRAEDALRESEEKFHEIFDNAIDGIELIEITDDGYPGRFIDLNAIACKMVHYTKEELLKMSPLDINTENFSQPFDEIMKELHAIGNARFETEHRRKDGTIFPIEVNTHIVTILGKKVILSIVRDITERKQMETALILSEQTYHSYVDNSPEGIFVADGAGRYLDVNRAACNLLGYSREELLSMNVLDLALPEEEQQTLDQFTSTIERLKSESSVSLEMLLKKKDGSVCPVILSVVKLPDNAIMGFTLDITERKRAEEERSRLSAIVEHTDEAIISKTLDGIITSWNAGAERMYGYSAQEIVGKSVSLLVPPDHPDDTMTIFERVKNGDPVIRYETLRRKKDGGLINVTLTASPIRDAYNRLIGTSIIGHDVTERKKAEEALQQANKQLSLLSGITRHDILNQLFALKGYIELSHEEIDNPTKLIELIKKEEKVARTIEHQITFTRDYQELGAAAPEWQSVNASITKAVAGLPMRDIHVEVDPKNPEVFADRLFEKVFYNLLDNALRYGGEQMKTIRVLSQESDASLTIICEDDGVGITAEDKKKLFTKGFGKNTGLGLFLSREILAITGITITENGVPGKGARFEITVPKGMWRIKDVDA
ncbi:MAG: PAS domain S-box protein, partial [Methanoregula sp.]